jgi:hypothetical protein
MRRVASASLALVGAMLLVPAASAQAPTQDSVVGTARGPSICDGSPTFPICTRVGWTFDVRSGPSGEAPAGSFALLLELRGRPGTSEISFPARVTCLNVNGNRATVGGELLSPPFPLPIQAGVLVYVEDNPDPGTDRVRAETTGATPPATCPAPPAAIETDVLGDVTVQDAAPLPTSTDQCKDGGWKTFGVFKSQGDCVSFVATGGKNPP